MTDAGTELIIFIVGLLYLVKIFTSFRSYVTYMINVYVLPRIFKRDLVSRYGQWALITGCTSGIGYSLTHELAARGFDIVLVSRSKDRLQGVAEEIKNKYKRKTLIVVANAEDRSSVNIVAETTKDLDIGILVNNVGVNTASGSDDMAQIKQDDIMSLININSGYLAALTRLLVPPMVARGRGLIVNLGSTSGYYCVPYQNIYTSTKCFIRILNQCMDKELCGVETCYLFPQFVRTNMTKGATLVHDLPFWTQTPDDYARYSISLLGTTKEAAGHWVFESSPYVFDCQKTNSFFRPALAAVIRKVKEYEERIAKKTALK